MKKITLTALISLLALAALPAYASTITLSPTTESVSVGETFTVTVNANPAGAKLYTVKALLSFPSSILEVTNFTVDSTWPLTPPGNTFSNANGTISQTAGFAGGFTETKRFGTVTFRAKANGSATVAVASGSAAYDAQSQNTISGAQGTAVVTVAAPVPVPKPTPAPTAQTQTPPRTVAQTTPRPAQTAAVTATDDGATTSGESADSQTAAAGLTTQNKLLIALAVLVLVIAGGAWWFFGRRKPMF
ncbi:MAG TPA: cohesin domain-containing protein [Candidatus Paceibacterota bacterium]